MKKNDYPFHDGPHDVQPWLDRAVRKVLKKRHHRNQARKCLARAVVWLAILVVVVLLAPPAMRQITPLSFVLAVIGPLAFALALVNAIAAIYFNNLSIDEK